MGLDVSKRLNFAAKSDIGSVRNKNEDSYAFFVAEADWPAIFIVADGMGGHSRGELASQTAVDYCKERLSQDLGPADQPERVEMLLRDTIQKANIEVYLRSLEDYVNSGMGTTLTIAIFYPEHMYLGHVGDSRCYISRKGILEKLSRDHTLVQKMQDEGLLTEEESSTHPQRHILTQALGVPDYLKPEILHLEMKRNDRYLLCSDGLHGFVEESVIEETMRKAKDPQLSVDELVELALKAGGHDNITAISIFL